MKNIFDFESKNQKKVFTICVDMDDTIENLLESWIRYLNIKYNLNKKTEEVTDWDMQVLYPELTKTQLYEPLLDSNFWKLVTPKEDAIIYLRQLFEEGHNIYICTCSHYATIKDKFESIILKYFNFIDWNHCIIIANKQLISCDIMIDDGIHNLVGGNYYKFLFTSPYNKNYNAEENGMTRVSNWKEVYEKIQILLK